MKKFSNNMRIFNALLLRDIKVLRSTYWDAIIDSAIIVGLAYLVYGHFMPLMGLNTNFVGPIFLGINVVVLINIMYDRALRDSVDLETTRFIDYQVSLPISISWLLAKFVISYVIDIVISWIPLALFGGLLFYQFLDINFVKLPLFLATVLLIIFTLATIFLLEVYVVSFEWFRENTYARMIMPSMLLGCIYYPWVETTKMFPILKYILLLSPTTYMVEGLRSALLTSGNFIPLIYCWIVLSTLALINILIVRRVMKKRIDAL